MKPTNKERLFWWLLVPALAAVLVALAIMQYRWSNQVSAATKAQMQSSLQTSMTGFRQDLSREIGAACLELRSAADGSGAVRSAQINQQFRHWQQTAAHPGLVEQVYLWRYSYGEDGPLLRVDSSRDQLENVEWPAGFDPLHENLQGMSSVFNWSPSFNRAADGGQRQRAGGRQDRHGNSQARPGGPPADPFLPWFVDQSIPAIVYPLRQRTAAGDADVAPAITWIIIKLNSSVLEKEIFPELAQKYFRGRAGLDYHVAVLAGRSGRERVIYSSDSNFAEQRDGVFDGAMNLFGNPFRRPESQDSGPDAFPRLGRNSPPLASRPPQLDDRRSAGADRLVRFEPLQRSREEGVWQIVVKHRTGSVEAAVSALRRRHLIASFGVLVLLAITMAMVMITSQRARRLAALQMNFVAGVSHELRTPLAVISSAAENIAHGVVADQQQMARYGASILKQTRQLSQLVEQVLVFATTQQKQGHYQLRPVDVAQVIDAALENTAGMTAAAGVTVERHVDPGLPPVAADFAALAQCLQNLITNAIKYGGEGRWMGIRATARRENGAVREVEVTVEDRGIGISPQEIKQIFEPFYRSPAVAGSNVHGTGLGLPLARTVIEAMRGRLTVASEPGKGSAFTVHLVLAAGLRLPDEEAALNDADRIAGEAAGYYP
ncbi:MAG TPA: HAMP domain-containing sensor histidine kinase [Candidatus Angelobacter sp.]